MVAGSIKLQWSIEGSASCIHRSLVIHALSVKCQSLGMPALMYVTQDKQGQQHFEDTQRTWPSLTQGGSCRWLPLHPSRLHLRWGGWLLDHSHHNC
jgi:hypothetical protein